ncbi:MAG: hypothetical protein QG670_1754 [Thermoproteota archaeon]|nr:hypothetical protein [Thermoproteota archaeon]
MKNPENKRSISLVFIICLSLLVANSPPVVRSQTSANISIIKTIWGTNLNTPTEAYSGDQGDSLTIEAKNLLSTNITGITATLVVSYPFSDQYGNHVLNATGAPVVYGTSPVQQVGQTGEISPKGLFTIIFSSINIDENAVAKTYEYNVTINYDVKPTYNSSSEIFNIKLVVSRASSTITCSVSPQIIEKGKSVDVTGAITPVRENIAVSLLYKMSNGTIINRTVTTATDGSYTDSYQPDYEGTWNINASWTGDYRYKESWSSSSFRVMFPVSLKVLTSDRRLVGGMDNYFNMSLINDGSSLLSSIDATLTLSAPLVLHSDNQWTFESLDVNNSIIIPIKIFCPSTSIGSTYQGQIQVTYRDTYGQSHTYTLPIGLIIIGRVDLVVYGKSINPYSPSPGSKVTFTATILNRGNVKVMYANVSLLSNPVLELLDQSTTYIGEIDENSPMPFTVSATINSNVLNGTYPVMMTFYYQDDQYRDCNLTISMSLPVTKTQSGQNNTSTNPGIMAFLKDNGLTIAALAIASISILFLYKRRLNHSKDASTRR